MTVDICYGEEDRKRRKRRELFDALAAITGILILFGLVGMVIAYAMAKNPPRWWLDKQRVSQQIQQQDDPTASVFLNEYAIQRVYIPPQVEATNGGEGVILVGPKDIINRLYREAYRLDDKGWPFEWDTE